MALAWWEDEDQNPDRKYVDYSRRKINFEDRKSSIRRRRASLESSIRYLKGYIAATLIFVIFFVLDHHRPEFQVSRTARTQMQTTPAQIVFFPVTSCEDGRGQAGFLTLQTHLQS